MLTYHPSFSSLFSLNKKDLNSVKAKNYFFVISFSFNSYFPGYGKGYNLKHKDISGLTYMPEGLEDVNFFD